ncbi:PREDICTED: protein SUPPRESSOR OF K(+) TRANSPORT GROWTH DEFECT 1-like [Nicotiana attenuata]|uniref:Protein suppressor of k(+) transport growth defect 1 n=1 Tax=Nicotiana attenuata TaxID=49451 RepID=A0A1J6INH9_NICAT|nr:PREDICTED: protein SUPPRESSOR OF K(+) TRANSPORT GROWTH DEFECT 1-like [Nicotiana attenuata]OIT06422.1 protein suppressor of k(+) transport growth defect 1 [Nicotiana attenuata]
MYSNFKAQAIEYVNQAVQEDNAGNYAKAFPLYMNALEYFKTHLKYEKDPKIKEAINKKFTEYLHRAEEIRAVMDDSGTGSGSSGGDAATRPKDGKNGEDPEPSELTAELNFVPFSSFKEQAIVYVKLAVQEDNDGNYNKAFSLYMNALEYFKTYLKYEKNPKIKEAITMKFNEYLHRAKKIRAMLDEGGSGPSPSGGDAAMATRDKTKPEDGEDGEDPK